MMQNSRKIRCPKCKDMYMFGGAIQEVTFCPECLIEAREIAEQVKDYVVSNKGCSVAQVAEVFSISLQDVKRHLKIDIIEILGDGHNFLSCEKCSKPINSGQYCDNCLSTEQPKVLEENKRQFKARYGISRSSDEKRMR